MNRLLDRIQIWIWYGDSLGITAFDLINFWDESIKNKVADGSHLVKQSKNFKASPNLKEFFWENYFDILITFWGELIKDVIFDRLTYLTEMLLRFSWQNSHIKFFTSN